MSQFPNIAAGTRITSAVLSSMLPNYVVKSTDTTRASVVTVLADPELVTDSLLANGVYHVQVGLRFNAIQAAGLRTSWLVPSGSSGLRAVAGPAHTNAFNANDSVVLDMRWATHALSFQTAYTDPRNNTTITSTNGTWVQEESIVTIGATAGTISVGWGQLVSNATGTIMNAGSFIRWQQVG